MKNAFPGTGALLNLFSGNMGEMEANMEKDIVILGGGPGGYNAAIRAAQLGAKAALVEMEKLGGTCLNKGCIPTKALYRSAQLIRDIKASSGFGIDVDGFSVNIKKMLERKQDMVGRLTDGIRQLLKANGVEVVNGWGRLVDRNTVEVTCKDEKILIRGTGILIATGSSPAMLPIEGAGLPGVMTSDQLLNLERVPESVVIVGGGVIGIEFAGILNQMGSRVTVLEYLPGILNGFDGEISKRLAMFLKKSGIALETGAKVTGFEKTGDRIRVNYEGKNGAVSAEAENVLISTGRRPNVKNIGLEKVGIEFDDRGIRTGEAGVTNLPGIYAAGDVTGGIMLAHVAAEEGKRAVEKLLGCSDQASIEPVPACVFSFPETASAGLTEEEAKSRGIPYNTGKFMFGANGKAMTLGEEEGFIKVLTAADSEEVIGVHILGPHAGELIEEGVLAIRNRLTVNSIAATVHPHPSLSEAFYEAVLASTGRAVHAAPKKSPGKGI